MSQSAALFAGEFSREFKPKPHCYELSSRFYHPIGWQRCHSFKFPCIEGRFEYLQDSLFGKLNSIEIKFDAGMCHPKNLLCIEVYFSEEKQEATVVFAEADDNEEWPDSIIRTLERKKPIGWIEVPLDNDCFYGEWDELRYWNSEEEEKKKADFLGLISAYNW